jgi:hypothetical protein
MHGGLGTGFGTGIEHTMTAGAGRKEMFRGIGHNFNDLG